MKAKVKYLGLITLIGFYLFAGINHFINPEFYLPLIPPYLPNHEMINWLAGIAEIVLAIGMIFPTTRRISAYGIIAMLIAFIPSHVYMIQLDSCITDDFCFDPLVGWVRLVVIHPILLLWAWWLR
jgi:uncharacterized membrane protein